MPKSPELRGRAFAVEAPSDTRLDLGSKGLRYTIGSGPSEGTLVFLHGWNGGPGGLFDALASELGKSGHSFTAVAPWLRSPSDDAPHTMTNQLARARAAIEATEGPVVLVGHSFGGKAALALAKELTGKVVGVVGLAPSVNMAYSYWKTFSGERGLPAPKVAAKRYLSREKMLRKELGRIDRGSEEGEQRASAIEQEVSDLDFQRDLVTHDEPALESHLATPTLVFQGTDDRAVSVHYIRRFAETNVDQVHLVELTGESHQFANSIPSIAQPLADFASRQLSGAKP